MGHLGVDSQQVVGFDDDDGGGHGDDIGRAVDDGGSHGGQTCNRSGRGKAWGRG